MINHLDPAGPFPLYHQLKLVLKHKIVNEVWPVGTMIPSEQELVDTYKISRTTVREAVSSLVIEGLLEKKRGRGTTVRATKVEERLGRLTGFAEELTERGIKHAAKLLNADFHRNRYYEIAQLGLQEDDVVFIIDRIRLADNEPIAYERSCWPEYIGRKLETEDLNEIAFYKVLEEKHGIVPKEASETIHAVNSNQIEADLLGISHGEALLERRRISYNSTGQPLEYTRTKYRNDKYAYKVHLERK